jgi:hypothetical protein
VSEAARKTLRFALSVLIVDIVLETITFEMPFSHDPAIWMRNIMSQLAEVPVICACAWVGAYSAFRLFPENLNLEPRQFYWMACAFVLITYFALSWVVSPSLILFFLVPIVVAFATIQSLGRWIASRNA